MVTDPERRAAIGEYYRQGWSEYRASPSGAARPQAAADPQSQGVQEHIGDSSTYLAEHMGDVPVLVLPHDRW